jgi:quercetin dioxygenase-like cupin family protein
MQSTHDETIRVGALSVRLLVDAGDSDGSVTVFECDVPAQSRMPAPHSHDGFEKTIYGLQGVSTVVDGEAIEIAPGEAVCVRRGSVHGFGNHGSAAARFLAIATPGVFGAAYFREIGDVLATARPPDHAALAQVQRRHGLTPAGGGAG